ncbi:hypothetical protein ACFLTH_08810 [Bacteroidota bacterium]
MKKHFFILLLLIPFFVTGCGKAQTNFSLVNTSHLDELYEEIEFDGKTVGIIHIYSNYPDYGWIGDDDEGIACIDDVARATVFYLKNYEATGDEASLDKAGRLVEFILSMQAENGYYYNFIFEDGTINTTHKNSLPQANWWTWRAMWALMEAYDIYKNIDNDFTNRIFNGIENAIGAIKENLPVGRTTNLIEGFEIPTWLPWKYAADQASVLLLSLVPYYEISKDEVILEYIRALQDGIILMQVDDEKAFAHRAFFSWRNMWHAYGNIQAYSLIISSYLSPDENLLPCALSEINIFYMKLMEKGYLANFFLTKTGTDIKVKELNKFSQIAYNIRPMVYACLAAYDITNDSTYTEKAAEIASWFFGNNPAKAQMYFPVSGIGFDGINSEKEINRNSGAESTIEALLTLQAIENNPIAIEMLFNIYKQLEK